MVDILQYIGFILLALVIIIFSIFFQRICKEKRLLNESIDELKQSEKKYRLLVENSHNIIYIINREGIITFISPRGFSNLGYPILQVNGKHILEFINPDDQERFQEDLNMALRTGEWLIGVEYRIRHVNGSWRWHASDMVTLRDETGTIIGFEGCAIDITDKKNTEFALQESKEQFMELAEMLPETLYEVGIDGIITYINEHGLIQFGYNADDIANGVNIFNLVSPDYSDYIIKQIQEKIQGIDNGYLEYWAMRKDGSRFWAMGLLVPIVRNDSIVGLRGFILDITEQKKTEEQIRLINQRMTVAAEAAKFGVWDLDLVNNHLEWDDWMLKLYNITREDFEENFRFWQKRIHPGDIDRIIDEFEKTVCKEKSLDTELRILWPNGETRYIKLNAVALTDKMHPVRMTGINYDITDRKQYEWEITQYAEELGMKNLSLQELSDELMQLNQDLDVKVKERTEEISRLLAIKTDLITQIGHDLKTPLTSLIALLPYIKKRVSEPDLSEMIEVVIQDAKRINQIISNVLTLSTIDIKKQDELLGDSKVSPIINRVISAEHYLIKQYNLQVINLVSPSLFIKMNESHIDLLFSNLISNSIKYSRLNGTIRIFTEINDDTFCFFIQDDGQGIAPDHLPRVFEEFFKADTSRHDRDSYGLGLALVQRIVKLYDGNIIADSEGINMGTTMRMFFPKKMIIDRI